MRWHNLLTALHSWAYFLSLLLLLLLLRLQWDKKQNATRNCKRYQIIFNYVRLVRVTGVARSNAAIRRPVPLCRYIHIYMVYYTHHVFNYTNRVPARTGTWDINSITNGCDDKQKMGQACDIITRPNRLYV